MDSLAALVRQDPLTAILVGLWIILVMSDAKGRSTFMDHSWKLLTEPSVAERYPVHLFERMEGNFKDAIQDPVSSGLTAITSTITTIGTERRWKLIGQFLFFLFLVLFFVADFIAIVGIVEIAGYSLNLPRSLQEFAGQYSIALTIGTFFSLLVSGLVVSESFNKSEFTDIGSYSGAWARIVRTSAIVVLISSLFVGVFLGLKIMNETVALPPFVDVIATFSIDVVVRANVLITTLIIAIEGLHGFLRAAGVVILGVLLIILGIIFICANISYGLGRLGVDIILRLLLWLAYLISFLVFSPFNRTLNAPGEVVKLISSLFNRQS